jgi:soluble lytic murein transglycosylase-like protein
MRYVTILTAVIALTTSVISTPANANWEFRAKQQYNKAKKVYQTRIEMARDRWDCPTYLPTKFFLSLMVTENQSLNPKSVSSAGAIGLMQIKPVVAKEIGLHGKLSHEYNNIWTGVGYLVSMKTRYKFNSLESIALAYKEGPTAAKRMIRSGFNPNDHEYVKRIKFLME